MVEAAEREAEEGRVAKLEAKVARLQADVARVAERKAQTAESVGCRRANLNVKTTKKKGMDVVAVARGQCMANQTKADGEAVKDDYVDMSLQLNAR
jgi:hypothetical protein